jgi:hypothetical protein
VFYVTETLKMLRTRSLRSNADIINSTDTINSTERGDNMHVEPGTKIHVSCRRDYCCKRSMQRDLMKRNQEESTSLTVARASRSTNLKSG